MADCARWASCADGPSPPSGLPIKTAAIPQVAIAHAGSCARTERNAPSSNQNEWSRATPRWRLSCTAPLQEFANSTLPRWSCELDWPAPTIGKQSMRATDRATMPARPLIDGPPVGYGVAEPEPPPGHLGGAWLAGSLAERRDVHQRGA